MNKNELYPLKYIFSIAIVSERERERERERVAEADYLGNHVVYCENMLPNTITKERIDLTQLGRMPKITN